MPASAYGGVQLKNPRRQSVLALTALCLLGIGHFLVTDRLERPGHDSSMYIGSAENLARHGSYEFNGSPVTWYPPGFPLMLASVIRATGDSRHELLIRFVSLTGMAGLLVWFAQLRPFIGTMPAWLILMLVAASPAYFSLSTWWVMADLPYFLLTGLSLWSIARLFREDTPALRRLWGVVAVAAAAFAAATRSVGVALAAALLAWALLPLIWRGLPDPAFRARKWAAAAGCAAVLVFLAWAAWSSAKGISEEQGGHMASYSSQFRWKNPLHPDEGYAEPADYLRRILQNLPLRAAQLASLAVPLPYQSPQWYNPLAVMVLGFAAWGAWRARREPWFQLASMYFAAYLGIMLLWPFAENPRFLLPAAPLAFALAWRGLRETAWPENAGGWRKWAVALWLIAVSAAATATGSSARLGSQERAFVAFWLLAATAAALMAAGLARWIPVPAWLTAHAALRPTMAAAAGVLIVAGIGLQGGEALRNLRPDPGQRPGALTAEAGAWLRQAPQGLVMAGDFAVIHRLSGRQVVSLPVTAEAGRLQSVIERRRVRYVIVAKPKGKGAYFQPPEHERLAILLKAKPGLLRLAHETPLLWIYETQPGVWRSREASAAARP